MHLRHCLAAPYRQDAKTLKTWSFFEGRTLRLRLIVENRHRLCPSAEVFGPNRGRVRKSVADSDALSNAWNLVSICRLLNYYLFGANMARR